VIFFIMELLFELAPRRGCRAMDKSRWPAPVCIPLDTKNHRQAACLLQQLNASRKELSAGEIGTRYCCVAVPVNARLVALPLTP
jgi:hypothetical protein